MNSAIFSQTNSHQIPKRNKRAQKDTKTTLQMRETQPMFILKTIPQVDSEDRIRIMQIQICKQETIRALRLLIMQRVSTT